MKALCLVLGLMIVSGATAADELLDIGQVIDGAYSADSAMRAGIQDFTMMAESFSRKLDGDDKVKEEKKFIKKYYFMDSLFKEEFIEYYKDGEKQDDEKLAEAVGEAAERRAKGRSRDASINPKKPFYPENRENYKFSMPGIESREGYSCYHIVADCLVDDEDMMEGSYWFDTDSLRLVYCEFYPAKMPSKIKQLDMKMTYGPAADGYWLPKNFHLYGRGKVMIFIKFRFAVEENYSAHEVNTGLTADFFKEAESEN